MGPRQKAAAFGTQTLLLEKGTFTDEEDMDRWIELSSRDRGQHCRFLFFLFEETTVLTWKYVWHPLIAFFKQRI